MANLSGKTYFTTTDSQNKKSHWSWYYVIDNIIAISYLYDVWQSNNRVEDIQTKHFFNFRLDRFSYGESFWVYDI